MPFFRGKNRQEIAEKTKKKKEYLKDSQLLKLILLADNKDFLDDDKTPVRTDYVKKREIDRSTLYSFDGPFQLFHVDVGNLEFLGKNATFPQYVLVVADLSCQKYMLIQRDLENKYYKKSNYFMMNLKVKEKVNV